MTRMAPESSDVLRLVPRCESAEEAQTHKALHQWSEDSNNWMDGMHGWMNLVDS